MPKAAETVLQAIARYPFGRAEDRLTEIFAYTLQAVPELAALLIDKVEAPPLGEAGELSVFTQNAMSNAGRPDMRIVYFDSAGNSRSILSEHKIDAPRTAYQDVAYPGWDSDKTIFIAPDSYPSAGRGAFDCYLTWREVAGACHQVGRRAVDSDRWRSQALGLGTLGRTRAVEEFIRYLESAPVQVGRMMPLTNKTVRGLVEANEALPTIENFVMCVSEHPELRALGSHAPVPWGSSTWAIYFDEARWPLMETPELNVAAEVVLQPLPEWFFERDDLGGDSEQPLLMPVSAS